MPADQSGKDQRLQRCNRALRQRPPLSARHERIDLLLDEAIEGGGCPGDQSDSQRAEDQRLQRHGARAAPIAFRSPR